MKLFITTSELIDEAEKLISANGLPNVQINHNKLLRWQRDGLLPRQQSCGAGPGDRQESLWEKSCIGRLQIIAGCVKGERLSRKNAEYALIAAGLGVRGDLLSKHLLAAGKQMLAELESQQRSDSSDSVDRASNLERSTSDRMSAYGESVKLIFAACRLGYTGLSEEEKHFQALATLASYFRPDALRELIENCKPEQLELAYRNPAVFSFAALVTSLFDLMYGHSKELPMQGVIDNAIITSVLEKFAPKPSGKLRRKKAFPYSKEKVRYYAHITALIFNLVYCQYKEKLLPLIPLVVGEILNAQEFASLNINGLLNNKPEEVNALFNLPSMPK